MSLRRRLERLEGGGGQPCPECGWKPDEVSPVVVVWDTVPEEDLGPERCAGCGRWLIIDWPDAPTPEEQARMEARMFAHAREHPEVHHMRLPAELPDHPPDSWPDEGEGAGS